MPTHCAIALALPVIGYKVVRKRGDTTTCDTNDAVNAGDRPVEDLIAEGVASCMADSDEFAQWVAGIPTETIDRMRVAVDAAVHGDPERDIVVEWSWDTDWRVDIVPGRGTHPTKVLLNGPGPRTATLA